MLKGNGISEGIGLGKAVVIGGNDIELTKFKVENAEGEIEFFKNAFNKVVKETKEIAGNLTGEEAENIAKYIEMLEEPSIMSETIKLIKENSYNAGYATEKGFEVTIKALSAVNDETTESKIADIEDIKSRVLAKIIGENPINTEGLEPDTILVTNKLTTSDLATIDFSNISGIITEKEENISRLSAIAKSRNVPIIVGMGNSKGTLKADDLVAMNGKTGEIYVNPSEKEIDKLKAMILGLDELQQQLKVETTTNSQETQQINTPSKARNLQEVVTLDNYKVNLKSFSTNDTQESELVIQNPKMFKAQLTGILKSDELDTKNIVLPMISSIEELRMAKQVLNETEQELKEENLEFNKNIKVGVTIGAPSAALIADSLADECDFLNIATEDIIQYTTALERGNNKVPDVCTKYNPGVIRLIKKSIDGAHSAGKNCSMYGEAVADKEYIPLILGLGLDEFSIEQNKIEEAKKVISTLNYRDCKELANKVLETSSTTEIESMLTKFNQANEKIEGNT